jgi:HNH endonuclease
VKTITLSQGKQALVDDEDYEWLLGGGNWSAAKRNDGTDLYYAVRNNPDNRRRQEYMHCVIMDVCSENGIAQGMFVDHIDGNGLNNQKANLEIVSSNENTRRYHARARRTK